MESSHSAMMLSHILGYILYNLPTASPLRGSHLLMTSVQGGVMLAGETSKEPPWSSRLASGYLPPSGQAWPKGSRNKLGSEPALEVLRLV